MSSLELDRLLHRPVLLTGLLVGESPPRGETFFYRASGHLFNAVRKAFARTLPSVPEGEAFLRWLCSQGWYLFDLSTERPRSVADLLVRRKEGEQPLEALLARGRPPVVIPILKRAEGHVQKALQRAGHKPAVYGTVDFPAHGHQKQFASAFGMLLESAADKGFLAPEAPILRVEDFPGYFPHKDALEIVGTPLVELYGGRWLCKLMEETRPLYDWLDLSEQQVEVLLNGLMVRRFFDLPESLSAVHVTDAGATRIIASYQGQSRVVECYAFGFVASESEGQ